MPEPKLTEIGAGPRERLSPVPENPQTKRPDPSLLAPHQQALRTAMVDAFNAKKARRFLERHVNHININRDLAEGIRSCSTSMAARRPMRRWRTSSRSGARSSTRSAGSRLPCWNCATGWCA
jgi:hypothetical protein